MIPISPERQEKQYKQQIADITQGIEQLKSENGESFQVKQMERTKKSLEQKLEKLSANKRIIQFILKSLASTNYLLMKHMNLRILCV